MFSLAEYKVLGRSAGSRLPDRLLDFLLGQEEFV